MPENSAVIVAGIKSLNPEADGGGLAEEIAMTERDLQKVQMEEDRAIRLYVSGKITESQLDHQRKFITELLEILREKLNDHRARESAQVERRELAEKVVERAERIGDGLDGLPQEKRREVLRLLLDGATIDKNNRVNLTLAIPTEDVVSIARLEADYSVYTMRRASRHSWRIGPKRPVKMVLMACRDTLVSQRAEADLKPGT